jgi:hypothetical protein
MFSDSTKKKIVSSYLAYSELLIVINLSTFYKDGILNYLESSSDLR